MQFGKTQLNYLLLKPHLEFYGISFVYWIININFLFL